MGETLAVRGGPKTIPDGTIKPWPPVDSADEEMVMASLKGRNHAFGPNCAALEEEFAAWNGNSHAITTNSGTAALHMGVAACDCGAGDEVIVPAYSWSSSATCVLQHNAIPVFVDIDYTTMNMDVNLIERAITRKTRAIIVVHLHGLPMDMDRVLAVAARHGLKVIEDACQAHGARFRGRKAGTIGHCAAFSMNQNKSLCSGEGGMFVTDDDEMLAKAQSLWSFGENRTPSEKRDYHVYAMGWMYRNNDLTAAFGRAQLKKLDRYLSVQRENGKYLTRLLEGTPGLILPREPDGCEHNYYNYTVRFDVGSLGHAHDTAAFRDRIMSALQAEGVETGIWQAYPLPDMTIFRARNGYGRGCPWECPHANPVDYSAEKFPAARRHCETHVGMTTPLRDPNGPEVIELVAKAFRRVMSNLDQV